MRGTGLTNLLREPQAWLGSDRRVYHRRNANAATQPSGSHRILVLSVSAGSGHVRAAQALCAHARADFPNLSLRHRDLMQLVPTLFRKIYTDLYMKLTGGLPEAWGWLYRKTDCEPTGSLSGRLRRTLQRLCAKKLFDEIGDFAPDAIICTHFLPAELLADAVNQRRLRCPVWVVVTDFDLHQMWVHPGITGYFVANEELAYRLQCAGVSEQRIVVTGIPVMPDFMVAPDRRACSEKIALDWTRPTLLMMGGGAGIGISAWLVQSILDLDPALQLVVLAGKNQALFDELSNLSCFYDGRLVTLGFTDKVPELMACADLVITKPGGLSTSECLTMHVPMLLINPIPGQEERNAAFLLQEGVAQRADDSATLIFRLRRLLADRKMLDAMKARAAMLAQPHAANLLLQRVMTDISLEATR